METGFLNFHDEEHFDVFSDENDLVTENSIFGSFVEVLSDNVASSPWILPDDDIELGFNSTATTETKEDFTKTFLDWQQHISNLQARDEDIKDTLCDSLEDVPDIFGSQVLLPKVQVPEKEKEKVQTYTVAERKGLVLKLTKKKDNCDKSNVTKPKKEDQSHLSKKKKKSVPLVHNVNVDKFSPKLVQTIKSEPVDNCDLVDNLGIVKVEKLSEEDKEKEVSAGDYIIPLTSIKTEPTTFLEWDEFGIGEVTAETVIDGIIEEQDPLLIDSAPIVKVEQINNQPEQPNNDDNNENNDCSIVGGWPKDKKSADSDSESDDESGSSLVPVLDNDVRSLLEQFEKPTVVKESEKNDKQTVERTTTDAERNIEVVVNVKDVKPKQSSCPSASTKPYNKSIIDVLPQQVIDKIKESSQRKKKCVPVVGAEPLPARGNAHLKDAGASPVKAVRMMNKQRSSEDTAAKLDHPYCTKEEGLDKRIKIKEEKQSPERVKKEWDSKKDSGLESGDVSDSSECFAKEKFTSPVQIKTEKEELEIENQIEPGEIVEEPKKRKLNLEEYRNRRRNVKPNSPIKERTGGWRIPLLNKIKNGTDPSKQMVNAEVQVEIDDKSIQTKENSSSNREEFKNNRLSRCRSSSSSSSSLSKSRFRRRGRSRRRNSGRSRWSHSRSRSRSRSRSKSRSLSRSPSRSRSSSRSSSYSHSSSSSRSRSHSRGSSRRRRRRNSYRRRSDSSHSYSRQKPWKRNKVRASDDWSPVEKMRQVEERRVIYVGRLEEGTTKAQLRERFACFGPIVDISLHFREKGDNYGFVTFAYKINAYEAVEHGNDYPLTPKYDICFGGRRAFCKQRYSDLDSGSPQAYSPYQQNSRSSDTFDKLLREAKKKLKRSSHV